MRRKKIRPSLVLCSPSLRTRQTLEAIEPSLGKGSSVELEPQLYAASEAKLLELLQALPESVDSVMLIGHNPSLHELALLLASRGSELPRLEQKFPTGALATLVVDSGSWAAQAWRWGARRLRLPQAAWLSSALAAAGEERRGRPSLSARRLLSQFRQMTTRRCRSVCRSVTDRE
jgi:phosphohistidine phosphatase SixA